MVINLILPILPPLQGVRSRVTAAYVYGLWLQQRLLTVQAA